VADKEPKSNLTPEEHARAKAWVDKHAPDLTCAVCGSQKFILAEHLVTPNLTRTTGGFMIGGVAYPQVMVICSVCAHTLYFNAGVIGLLKKPESESQGATTADAETPDG